MPMNLPDFKDAITMNANAQHALTAMLCSAASVGFDGDGESGMTMREGFAHLMRLLQQEREDMVETLTAAVGRTECQTG